MSAELNIHNAHAVPLADCPIVPLDVFRESVTQGVADGSRLTALLAFSAPDGTMRLLAALARPSESVLSLESCEIGSEYPSLTPDCPQAHWFEREIAEIWGIRPIGHPWLKPIRFQPPFPNRRVGPGPPSKGAIAGDIGGSRPTLQLPPIGIAEFFSMQGEEVHEVAVGPVHAGVIEPGHFRFQCHGEKAYHLEISLGYQHRGIERALRGGPDKRTRHYMETLAGDTTIGHATTWSRVMESLAGVRVPPRAQAIRGVAAELERLANHIGDLGALAGDVGYLPTMSFCGRIRGDALNMTALICGNRFGRGLLAPGGVAYDLDAGTVHELLRRLDSLESDARGAIELMFRAPSVLARFEGVGIVTAETAREIGLVGVAARACGLDIDARKSFPYGIYRFAHIPVCTWASGDCFARAYVRWMEVQQSIEFIREQLRSLPEGSIRQPAGPLAPNMLTVALTEGWRGEIAHVAATDSQGRFAFYKVIDPSFHNWFGLACALRNQQISDFPLCNKSFNLSYCGHDL